VWRGNRWNRAETGGDARVVWKTVVADGAGAFAGSADGVVIAIGRGSPLRVALDGGLPAPRAGAIAPDGRGAAWVVSGGHLVRADAEARRFVVDDVTDDARAVTIAPDGTVVAAGRWTVRARGASGWTDLRPDVNEADPSFTAAHADESGALWVGTRSGAIYRYDGDIWLRMARGRETLDGRGILDVRTSPGGTWAIGAGVPVRCVDGGVERFGGIDSTQVVVDLEWSPAGRWVAATASRLFVFDDDADVWRERGIAEIAGADASGGAAIDGAITALAFGPDGTLYLGSTGGLGVAGPRGVRWVRAADGTGGGEIADLVADARRLWIGFAQDGLSTVPLERLR
jgi:hypothetical protein